MINLGDKVKCLGYYKKTGKFIVPKDYFDSLNVPYEPQDESTYWTNEGHALYWEELVPTQEFIPCEFEGFVCGKKTVYTMIYPTLVYIGPSCDEVGMIYKDKPVKCYEIAYTYKNRWCKRYVPMDKVVK